jgi:hypothetical protein
MRKMEKVVSKNGLSKTEKVQITLVFGFIIGVISLIIYNMIVLGTNSSI